MAMFEFVLKLLATLVGLGIFAAVLLVIVVMLAVRVKFTFDLASTVERIIDALKKQDSKEKLFRKRRKPR